MDCLTFNTGRVYLQLDSKTAEQIDFAAETVVETECRDQMLDLNS